MKGKGADDAFYSKRDSAPWKSAFVWIAFGSKHSALLGLRTGARGAGPCLRALVSATYILLLAIYSTVSVAEVARSSLEAVVASCMVAVDLGAASHISQPP